MQICSWMSKYLRFSPRQYFQMAGDPLGFLANGVNIQSGKLFFKGFIIVILPILQHCRQRISLHQYSVFAGLFTGTGTQI